jgi:hypothetical protein
MAAGEVKLKERVQGLAAIGAAPSVALGVAGDLFSPVGGWIVVGAAGILALFVATYLLAKMTLKREMFFDTLWGRLTTESPDSRWIWNPSRPWTSHGLHIVIAFGLLCLFISGKSFAARATGGIVASNVTAISVAQQQLGVSEKLYQEARKTNQTLESIDTKADNFKRESSDDPRKELLNTGVLWEASRLDRAIADADIRTVDLFLRGGMPISAAGAVSAFTQGPAVTELLVRHSALFDAAKCEAFLGRLGSEKVLAAKAHGMQLLKALCANDSGRQFAKRSAGDARETLARESALRRQEDAKRRSSAECTRHFLSDRTLGDKAIQSGNDVRAIMGGLSDYDYMLIKIKNAIMSGRTDYRKEIGEYCDKQAVPPERSDHAENNVKAWENILDAVD